MHTDSYALAVRIDMLQHSLARARSECIGPPADGLDQCALRQVQASLCPCILGDDCICEAVARDFERHLDAERRIPDTRLAGNTDGAGGAQPLAELDWESEGGRCKACFGVPHA